VKRPKTVEGPPPSTLFFCRSEAGQHTKADPGFLVIKWGSSQYDAKLQTDVIPAGFLIERQLPLEPADAFTDPTYAEEAVPTNVEEDAIFTLRLRRNALQTRSLQFQTRFDTAQNKMQYAVKEGKASTFGDADWHFSSTAAFDAFRDLNRFKKQRTFSGPVLFGLRSDEVQAELASRRTNTSALPDKQQEKAQEKQGRGVMQRASLKEAAKSLDTRDKHSSSSSSSDGTLDAFGLRSVQSAVTAMLATLESFLIEGREPEQRLLFILDHFLDHPDIKRVLVHKAERALGLDSQELAVVVHTLDQLKMAISTHKTQRNRDSQRLYQTLLTIIASPPGARLQRATARLFGLKSRSGLRAAQVRKAEQLVDVEGGIWHQLSSELGQEDIAPKHLFYPSDRRERADWIASEPMRNNASGYFKFKTRVTSCRKAVVPLEDGTEHPIHYLEEKLADFHRAFLNSGFTIDPTDPNTPVYIQGGHFYQKQLLVRNVADGITSGQVRSAFAQWSPTHVMAMSQGTYFYVGLSSDADCDVALRAATSEGFALSGTITKRPLMGYTAFANQRPAFVKDATVASCVCGRCQDFVYMLEGAFRFKHWKECCPVFAELLDDVKLAASPFSPSVVNLLDVLLCEREASTEFLLKTCCYGECDSCGWAARVGQHLESKGSELKDEIAVDEEDEEKAVFVQFQAYETTSIAGGADEKNDDEAVQKKSCRPALLKQSVLPSVFLRLFQAGVQAYQQHRFIAVHQTHMEQLLKTRLREVGRQLDHSDDDDESREEEKTARGAGAAEECICVDMDFAENYEIVHKIEIQSEHWQHQQVTLYIVITHFKTDGVWTSEAHVFVSADRDHDTYFVQRAMAALAQSFKERGREPKTWYFNTDGAPSHFKNKYTMQSLFTFKSTTGALTVLWETCAPGHGKGPWDGIGAVIKRFLRLLEKNSKAYALGAKDVFCALLDQFEKTRVASRVTIAEFVFHYILSPGEPPLPGRPNVWSPILRPSVRPAVTAIKGIRSTFCFRVAGPDTIAVRELSCRCSCCLQHRWTDCKSTDAGEWRSVTMTKRVASAGAKTRTQRTEVSALRRQIAQKCQPEEVIAMESCDDPDGFSFWLARALGPAFKYTGPAKTEDGRKFVPGTWYIKVRYYDRFPVDSASTFKLGDQVQTENAEGVIARQIRTMGHFVRRSARVVHNRQPSGIISLDADQIHLLNDLPSLDDM
jgi:hypothetical protein